MNNTDGSWPVPSGPTLEEVKETIASLEASENVGTPRLDTEQRPRAPRGRRFSLRSWTQPVAGKRFSFI
jgi:hypothetical protein